jgi:hypothetical protein
MAVKQFSNSNIFNGIKFNRLNQLALIKVDYLVVAGGGGGGNGGSGSRGGGGGGAGGFLDGSTLVNRRFLVTVGAGGAIPPAGAGNLGTKGNNSVLGEIVSFGGGRGDNSNTSLQNGGSGGGNSFSPSPAAGGAGTPGQGFNGGSVPGAATGSGSGGGGASSNGANGVTNSGAFTAGGNGKNSSITGTSVLYARGGRGGPQNPNTAGSTYPNLGSGGDGAGGNSAGAGSFGREGVVIIKYPNTLTLSVGVGLTSSTSNVGDFKVTQFTAGSDFVEFV